MSDDRFHYPPELLSQLVDTIPLLCKSKKDTLLFFRGAGMTPTMTAEVEEIVDTDRSAITKFEIARRLLTRLNELGDRTLAIRRELLRRVVEFEDFTRCWESDVMRAKGLIAEIQRTVNVKDSFTRMRQARDQEAEVAKGARERELRANLASVKARRERIATAKANLFALFAEADPHKRGKALEAALNNVFAAYEIKVEENFRRVSEDGAVLEQIDGVIEIDDETFIVEMKWWSSNMGPGEVSQHISRILLRPGVAGLFISNTSYTPAALDMCKDFLQHGLLILCTLQEIVSALEREADLVALIKAKVRAAKLHKKPFWEILE
jgi:hypothetical protein